MAALIAEPAGPPLAEDSELSKLEGKRHSACDECRKRKLKCSGELSGCVRCLKQSIHCVYSLQKPMGRPPKKRARSDEESGDVSMQGNTIWPTPQLTPPESLSSENDANMPTDASYICPQFFMHPSGQSQSPESNPPADDDETSPNWRPELSKNRNLPVPGTSSPWPDFTTVSQSSSMLFPAPTNSLDPTSLMMTPPMSNLIDPLGPKCTCLSYLYLCLSHISSLASFPVNSHTLCSLYIAARTALDVIRCDSCPKSFATGVQNVMFTGTLLTVVADAWLRVYNSDPMELGKQSAPPEFVSKAAQCPDQPEVWKNWLRQIVRQAVVGGYLDPEAGTRCSKQRDLLSLIRELEERQHRWHTPGQHPLGECNPLHSKAAGQPRADPDEDNDEKELLCIRVVGSARSVLTKFNFEPQDFPGGVIPDDMARLMNT
ncbi:Fungal Zn(2)-Cys(6) binuclear cluster domain-containing protein [Penicillium ucsense]|uniref:Fungal Zn(2)-Cys(6) binuclear cluster domain-containing protein n=1 Tax=Penicillium ucsense TaxID=2839758 RepID=A0A8J8WKQ1_9EURO|nr:Fungal Zn(2)-Cys(6) binuclear cluster domain-containing protein [Penicillium ucsense]KAF7738686.1 Fungal Zn(2)-Cys(6) binuclear cluster domain-containing protein [Penicillium ucsense]